MICSIWHAANVRERYVMRVKIGDKAGALWTTIFDQEIEKILCCPVSKMKKLKASNTNDYLGCIRGCLGKKYHFNIQVSPQTSDDKKGFSYTCMYVLNPTEE